MDTIIKKTVCSAPKVEVRGDKVAKFSDATMLLETSIPQVSSSVSTATTPNALSMSPRATIDLI